MSLTLSLRRPECHVTIEIKSKMTDSLWKNVAVVYSDSEPFLQVGDKKVLEPLEIISYLQALAPPSPSVLKQLESARQASVRALKEIAETGTALAPIEMVQYRRSMCLQCPFGQRKFLTYKCTQCGCHIKTKTALITESCPIGKW